MQGRTLATAESCTGGMIGQMLTDVAGSSAVFKGGIISYCNDVKEELLGVSRNLLDEAGPVSASVAQEMASGARAALHTDVAVSVTGLAGPGGDEFGTPVGTAMNNAASAINMNFRATERRSVNRRHLVH